MADFNSAFTGEQIDAGIGKADTAVQPADIATVATTGDYADLSGLPTLGTAAATDATDYATAAQGALADTAVQAGDDASVLGSGAALEGYVLAADGAGGAAWEEAAGGGATDYVRTRSGTTQDVFDMADTWNDAAVTFNGIKLNVTDTASNAASNLLDLQVGGVSRFSVGKGAGAIFDTNLIEQRASTNAQAFNIYNSFTDASNHERARLGWSGNVFEIKPQAEGTGTLRTLHISGLPTSDPAISGVLWNDAGTVKVSAG